METVLAILVLAALVGGIYLWQKGVGAARKGITRAVAHGTHVRGQDAVHRQLDFTVPVPAESLLSLIKQRLEVVPSPPAIQHDVYLAQDSDDLLVYAVGNKLYTALRYAISVDNVGDHATGLATVLDWTESDGLVTHIDKIERLERHVTAAVETVGGSITVTAKA